MGPVEPQWEPAEAAGKIRRLPGDRRFDRPPDRRRVLLFAHHNSYRISAYSEAARTLGIELTVASEGTHSLVPEAVAGLQVDLQAPTATIELVLAEARRRPFAGVVAADDGTVELASRVARALGLPHNSPQAARISRRKDLARATLAAAGIPVPRFRRLDLSAHLASQIAGLTYPCVAKPLALAGSRGVIRANNPQELIAACHRIAVIIQSERDDEERRHVLIEEFIPGNEVAVEGLLDAGELTVLALFDKPEPLNGPYFEESYYVTPSRLHRAVQNRIHQRLKDACTAYGLHEGPVHAELRLNQGDAWILEVAARTIGGDCARLLKFGAGRSLEELVLRRAIGQPLAPAAVQNAAGVMMIPTPRAGVLRRVEGILAARKVTYIEDVTIAICEGHELIPLPEGGRYVGFIFARAPTPEAVEQALRQAYQSLNIVVAPMWHLRPACSKTPPYHE